MIAIKGPGGGCRGGDVTRRRVIPVNLVRNLLLAGLLFAQAAGGDILQCRNRDGDPVFTDDPRTCDGDEITRLEMTAVMPEESPRVDDLPVCPQGEGLRRLGESPFGKVDGLAFDGEYLWAFIYLDPEITAVKIDPETGSYEGKPDGKTSGRIRELLATPNRPRGTESAGGATFYGGELWLSGVGGDVFGSLDPHGRSTPHRVMHRYRSMDQSQSYSAIAHDGSAIWVIWQGQDYRAPDREMQRLIKLHPLSGGTIADYPAVMGAPLDSAHGLAWDGRQLWHGKGNRVRSVDPRTGLTISEYRLEGPTRISGMTSDGCNLFLAEFSGAIWKVSISRLGG